MQQERIWLSSPHMSGHELPLIHEAFETNWVSPAGPHLTAFEHELAEYNKIDHVAALSSGTAAIHLALIILGVKPGDEVICQTFTFSGSCNPIAYTGAIPVFVDSERITWNIDPVLLEEAITDRIKKKGKKPRAIIAVHLYGMPAKMLEIQEIAKRFEIPLIEDAAEGLGSTLHGQKLGTFGDFGIYSFNGNKIITTSGGGALASNSEACIQRARFLATQARDPAPHYQHTEIGYNYRLSNVSAAIGRGQLKVLEDRVDNRRANFEFYRNELKQFANVAFLPEPPGAKSNRWLTTVTFEKSDNQVVSPESVRQALERENIESRPLWKPMHLQPVFKECPAYVNQVSEKLFESGLCLPSGSNLTAGQKARVVEALKRQIMK